VIGFEPTRSDCVAPSMSKMLCDCCTTATLNAIGLIVASPGEIGNSTARFKSATPNTRPSMVRRSKLNRSASNTFSVQNPSNDGTSAQPPFSTWKREKSAMSTATGSPTYTERRLAVTDR